MEIKRRKIIKKTPKNLDLFGPSFDYSDLLFRLNTLKAAQVTSNDFFFRDNENFLPLYRPFSKPKRASRKKNLSIDLPPDLTEDESPTKHRRQLSQNIGQFKLKPIRVHESSKLSISTLATTKPNTTRKK